MDINNDFNTVVRSIAFQSSKNTFAPCTRTWNNVHWLYEPLHCRFYLVVTRLLVSGTQARLRVNPVLICCQHQPTATNAPTPNGQEENNQPAPHLTRAPAPPAPSRSPPTPGQHIYASLPTVGVNVGRAITRRHFRNAAPSRQVVRGPSIVIY